MNKVLRLVARRRLESAEIKRKIARDKYKKAIKNKKYNDVIEYKKKALESKRDIIDAYSNKSNYSLYDIIDYLYNKLFKLFELSGSVSYFDIKMQLLKFKDGECTIDQIYDSIIESCMAQKTSEIVHEFISGDEEK